MWRDKTVHRLRSALGIHGALARPPHRVRSPRA
jgi:hypothetical protein